jgi:hypothetical protein
VALRRTQRHSHGRANSRAKLSVYSPHQSRGSRISSLGGPGSASTLNHAEPRTPGWPRADSMPTLGHTCPGPPRCPPPGVLDQDAYPQLRADRRSHVMRRAHIALGRADVAIPNDRLDRTRNKLIDGRWNRPHATRYLPTNSHKLCRCFVARNSVDLNEGEVDRKFSTLLFRNRLSRHAEAGSSRGRTIARKRERDCATSSTTRDPRIPTCMSDRTFSLPAKAKSSGWILWP